MPSAGWKLSDLSVLISPDRRYFFAAPVLAHVFLRSVAGENHSFGDTT